MAKSALASEAPGSTPGSPAFPEAAPRVPPTPRADIDAALEVLGAAKDVWARLLIADRIAILAEMASDLSRVSAPWVEASIRAKGIDPGSPAAGEEWGYLAIVHRLVRLWRRALGDIVAHGRPRLPRPVTLRPDGRVVVGVFPPTPYDALLFPGLSAEVWLEPGVSCEAIETEQASAYRRDPPGGRVALVLSAGNLSCLGPADVLHKLFAELQVVVLKVNPVNAYLGPLFEQAFAAVVRRGFLRVIYGDAETGSYLARHPRVDEIHLTGSDKTYEAIMFGSGEEGRRRKAARAPLVEKRFTCELGTVSPVIVVPGPWSPSDIGYQAEHIVSMMANNAAFNCTSARVVVQHASWDRRTSLLEAIRGVMGRVPTRTAFYPGARARHAAFLAAYPRAEAFGSAAGERLPWTLAAGIDPEDPGIAFTREAFCSFLAETGISGASTEEFLERAVAFVNDGLWGSLSAHLIVHPRSLADARVAAGVDRAIANLRSGTVAVNVWSGLGYYMGVTTWGAFPGHPSHDIQSGQGVVHNLLMLPRPEKSVLRGPFRQWPKPFVFATHRTVRQIGMRLAAFESSPSPWRLPGLVWAALRG